MDESAAPEDIAEPGAETPGPPPRRRGRLASRLLLGLGAGVVALAALAGVLYAFGTMQAPEPAVVAAYEAGFALGNAPRAEGRFHIPVIGCVCHSSDPRTQVEHSRYYLRECSTCHAGG